MFAATAGWLIVKPGGGADTRADIHGDDLPELPASEWLHLAWVEAGRVHGNGPLPWTEIEAFGRVSLRGLRPVEAQTIRRMSEAFAAELHDDNPLRKRPGERRAG